MEIEANNKLYEAFFANKHFSSVRKGDNVNKQSNTSIELVPLECYGCNGKGWINVNPVVVDKCPICGGRGSLIASPDGQIFSLPGIIYMENENVD